MLKNLNQALYLASGSRGRQEILADAKIPFIVHRHFSKEEEEIIFKCGDQPLQFVTNIVIDKINKVELPDDAKSYDKVFVLTGDTLVFTKPEQGRDIEYLSKPIDKADAIRMLNLVSKGPIDVVTVAALECRTFDGKNWNRSHTKIIHSPVEILWQIPESDIEFYLSNCNYTSFSSAATIGRNIGDQYMKWIKGSYSAVVGLPIFEVRLALEEEGYLDKNRGFSGKSCKD